MRSVSECRISEIALQYFSQRGVADLAAANHFWLGAVVGVFTADAALIAYYASIINSSSSQIFTSSILPLISLSAAGISLILAVVAAAAWGYVYRGWFGFWHKMMNYIQANPISSWEQMYAVFEEQCTSYVSWKIAVGSRVAGFCFPVALAFFAGATVSFTFIMASSVIQRQIAMP